MIQTTDIQQTFRLLFDLPELEISLETYQLQSIGDPVALVPCGDGSEYGENPIPEGEPYEPVRRSPFEGGFFLKSLCWSAAEIPWEDVSDSREGENLENQFAKNYTSFSSRFRFNEGKALRNRPVAYFSEGARLPRGRWDAETGNFYYGARYYDPRVSVWLSVDPLAHKMPAWSPYSFTFNNPIRYVDPDGRWPIIPWLLKATAGAAADMMAQASMDYLFNPNTSSWSQAFDNVNYYQVARSGAEGLIPWRKPGGRIGRAAGTALVDVLVNAANDPSGYSPEQAGMDFATGFIGDLAGGGFGTIINKYGSGAVINGLMGKLGYSASQIRKMTGGFDGESVRAWYKSNVDAMNLNVAPTEANARQIVNQRNMYKQQARDLMSDQNAAANLPAIQGYDYYYQKYYDEGYRGEDLYNQIINAGGRTNPTYNQKFGE